MFVSSLLAIAIACAALSGARAESHAVHFVNKCNTGTPTLKSSSGATLSSGKDYTANGPLVGAVAYLQTGKCAANGSGCNIVELALENPTSSIDINALTAPVNAPGASVKFSGGGCSTSFCNKAVCVCQGSNVGVQIQFC